VGHLTENSLYSGTIHLKSDWLQYFFILGIISTYITFCWNRKIILHYLEALLE